MLLLYIYCSSSSFFYIVACLCLIVLEYSTDRLPSTRRGGLSVFVFLLSSFVPILTCRRESSLVCPSSTDGVER